MCFNDPIWRSANALADACPGVMKIGDTFKRFRNSWFNLLVKTDPLSLDMVVGKEVCEKYLLTRHKPSVLSLVSKAKQMDISSGYLLQLDNSCALRVGLQVDQIYQHEWMKTEVMFCLLL